MKKIVLTLMLLISIIALISCDYTKKEITCEDVINAYEEVGYNVFHKEYNYEEGQICYVKCTALDSDDYIYFNFFENQEFAEKYANERDWNIVLFIYSCSLFEPTWLTAKTYSNIEIEYHQNYLYKPFKSLM